MSAFTLNTDHIDLLVSAAMRIPGFNPQYINMQLTGTLLGQKMLAENYASVNHRYSESEQAPEYEWTPVQELQGDLEPVHLVQIIKAAECFDYQSCEHSAWSDSTAFWASMAIHQWATARLNAINYPKFGHRYPGDSREPRFAGMDDAAWEWSRDAGFPQQHWFLDQSTGRYVSIPAD